MYESVYQQAKPYFFRNTLLFYYFIIYFIIPKDLESIYYKLIKATLGVRHNTPNDIVLIEAGILSKEIIYCRQLNFFKRFQKSLEDEGRRKISFNKCVNDKTSYVKHCMD